MNILIVDLFNQKRDPAQAQIYKYLQKNFNSVLVSKIYDYSIVSIFDIIYFGIYHQGMVIDNTNEKSFLVDKIVKSMNSEQLLIVDQCDNESYIKKPEVTALKYKNFKGKKVLLDRYDSFLPLKDFARNYNFDFYNLPWSVNSIVIPDAPYKHKDIDVTFISTIVEGWEHHSKRSIILENFQKFKQRNTQYSLYISCPPMFSDNTVYGQEYLGILRRTKIFITEGSGRYCLTQKYLEAGVSKALVVGDQPKHPNNNIFLTSDIMYPSDLSNYEKMEEDLNYLLANPKIINTKTKECLYQIKAQHNIDNIMGSLVSTHFPND